MFQEELGKEDLKKVLIVAVGKRLDEIRQVLKNWTFYSKTSNKRTSLGY